MYDHFVYLNISKFLFLGLDFGAQKSDPKKEMV
jgi:hypothetical protein